MSQMLPVEAIRKNLVRTLSDASVVLTAPTGSGKSTQVPRWCAASGWRTLIVEPRRVACRGLAARVAELEACKLGSRVGYAVRDDVRMDEASQVVFATPGIVLRWLADNQLDRWDAVIIDEFHERSLDVDLLLALLAARFKGRLAVMSATLDGPRIAAHLGGHHLKAEGRLFDVAVHYLPGNAFLPDIRGLEGRVVGAVKRAASDPGDILVFLPGKGEISSCAQALTQVKTVDVLPIHGGLTLAEQSRVFAPGKRKRVILATNVAETSITVPGVGVVIDSGLVRRTRYHNGRGFLTLAPIAADSAEQRTGRAGRTAEGICYRLWSREAILTERTPPEIHREALSTLVMAAAACRSRPEDLPFLDAPKPYAVEAAREHLRRLGALHDEGEITERGRHLFHLPLDPPLAALLVAADGTESLDDVIDLVAGLAVGRPLYDHRRPDEEERDLRRFGCDAVATILAVRATNWRPFGLHPATWQEARHNRKRLRGLFNRSGPGPDGQHIDRKALALTVLTADPRSPHVPRVRKRNVAWGNGGTELALSRESAVDEGQRNPLLVLESRALGLTARKGSVIITCGMPVPNRWLLGAGVGEAEVLSVSVDKSQLVATLGQTYAGAVLGKQEEVPTGPLAREALARLFFEGRLWRRERVLDRATERLAGHRLIRRLHRAGLVDLPYFDASALPFPEEIPTLENHIASALLTVGFDSGHDLPLLTPDDLLPPSLPAEVKDWLERRYPQCLDLGDGTYDIRYDLGAREVTLDKRDGQRKTPPSITMLPSWRGFAVKVKHGSKTWRLR